MKNKKNSSENESLKRIAVLIILISSVMAFTKVNAQRPPRNHSFANYYRNSSVFMLGIEGGTSTRTLSVKSNIKTIDNLQITQEGWGVGLVVGGANVRTRFQFGKHQMTSTSNKDIRENSFSGTANVYPFEIFNVPSKYFKPYIIAGIDVSQLRFKGTFIPAPKKPLPPSNQQCNCQCDGGSSGLPADPDLVDDTNSGSSGDQPSSGGPPPNPGADPDLPTKSEEQPRVDKLIATQAMIGFGIEGMFKVGNRFYSMFGEARYGIPLGTEALTAPLADTSVNEQISLCFGLRIGLFSQQ